MRQGLDILHQRRPAADPALEHPLCLVRRARGTAVDETDQRRLLAGQEPRRHLGQLDADPVSPGRRPAGQRSVHVRGQVQVAGVPPSGQAQVGRAGAGRFGGRLQAVEYQVRRVPEQGGVLAASRLAFGGVRHHDAAASAGSYRSELPGHAERGAAAPCQPGCRGLLGQCAAAVSRQPAAAQMRGQVESRRHSRVVGRDLRGGRKQPGQSRLAGGGRVPGPRAAGRHGAHRTPAPVSSRPLSARASPSAAAARARAARWAGPGAVRRYRRASQGGSHRDAAAHRHRRSQPFRRSVPDPIRAARGRPPAGLASQCTAASPAPSAPSSL